MPSDPIELFVSREGDAGASKFRLRRFLVNFPTSSALAMGLSQGSIQPLGASFTFDDTPLYVGGYSVLGTESSDWSQVDVQYVREGELRYAKIPTEVGYKVVSGSVASTPMTIYHIQRKATSGVNEYFTIEQRTKRREVVLTITANIASSDMNATTVASIQEYQNTLVHIDVGSERWLFESVSWSEISDRVTQVVGVFRGTDRRPEIDPGSPNAAGQIYIPELPPFSTYQIVAPENGGEPSIIAIPEYDSVDTNPEFFSWFLPVFA